MHKLRKDGGEKVKANLKHLKSNICRSLHQSDFSDLNIHLSSYRYRMNKKENAPEKTYFLPPRFTPEKS